MSFSSGLKFNFSLIITILKKGDFNNSMIRISLNLKFPAYRWIRPILTHNYDVQITFSRHLKIKYRIHLVIFPNIHDKLNFPHSLLQNIWGNSIQFYTQILSLVMYFIYVYILLYMKCVFKYLFPSWKLGL